MMETALLIPRKGESYEKAERGSLCIGLLMDIACLQRNKGSICLL